MSLSKRTSLLKKLQTELPRGAPFNADALRGIGVSAALAWRYVHSGWLQSLGRGLFMFPNDQFNRDACLKFLATRIPGLHVGGKTALAWRGVRHNVAFRETLILLGEASARLPDWFATRFPSRYAARHLFSHGFPKDFGLKPLPQAPEGPLVSERERALLEMLSEVGLNQEIEEARNVMEGLYILRPEVLETMLKACERVKVVRLCVQWSDELGLPWAGAARQAVAGEPGQYRWSSRMRNGKTLVLKPV
jgi:Transcriptional regulator, AbiEi antitoxin, Type IV TA system/Transcriptional regulator, AbiEi antitoxin N-terminal domain